MNAVWMLLDAVDWLLLRILLVIVLVIHRCNCSEIVGETLVNHRLIAQTYLIKR